MLLKVDCFVILGITVLMRVKQITMVTFVNKATTAQQVPQMRLKWLVLLVLSLIGEVSTIPLIVTYVQKEWSVMRLLPQQMVK